MTSAVSWRTYTAVLTHLRSSTQPPSVLQSLLAHHLATPPTATATPLAAASVSSPYFIATPFTYERTQAFEIAYRQAAHLCWKALESGLLTPSKQTQMLQWTSQVLSGLKNGNSLLRLAACAGLLLGLQDLEAKTEQKISGRARNKLEDETVLALAECLDIYSAEWVKEYGLISAQPASSDPLYMSLMFASHVFEYIPRRKLAVLPLPLISHLLASAISEAFLGGAVFSQFLNNIAPDGLYPVAFKSAETAASSLRITADPLYAALPTLCRFLSLTLTIPLSTSKPDLSVAQGILKTFDSIAAHADALSVLDNNSSANDARGEDVAPSARAQVADFFATVKTLLFCTVMVADAVVAHAVYVPPAALTHTSLGTTPASTVDSPIETHPPVQTPSPAKVSSTAHAALCRTLLRTLSRLAPAMLPSKATFPELARAFYAALDVLAVDASAADAIVVDITTRDRVYTTTYFMADTMTRSMADTITGPVADTTTGPMADTTTGPTGVSLTGPSNASPSRTAFALACIEQLVPVLSVGAVESAWGYIVQYVSDPTSRDVYEAAHSTALAIFDIFAPGEGKNGHAQEKNEQTAFVARLVPYYAGCLVENASPDRLSLAQLRHAYAMVVRCAGAHEDALAMYCVQQLLDATHGPTDNISTEAEATRQQRLRLTLASTISSVPVSLLALVLEELKTLMMRGVGGQEGLYKQGEAGEQSLSYLSLGERVALRDAIFEEIAEKLGNAGKEYALQWWYTNRSIFPAASAESKAEGPPFEVAHL
ncbi:hypothetical protein BD626DRAFT_264045 [Schizophyllum amplum]|uniref:Uncharacterized protein n=1 Tax=Schizophyllum amplum TaxID=97359 RepID=A0A550CGU1_9AGAR|nr:hypothetical protein BD626DRAFT_264045 [Auriculariopsis ampla]